MKYFLFFIFFFFGNLLIAQIGGESVFNFLNVPNSARAQYLGKAGMSYNDGDIGLIISNPSHLSEKMNKQVLISTNFLFKNSFNTIGYVQKFKKIGTFGFVLQGNSYGKIPAKDANGVDIGTLTPIDVCIHTIYARALGNYQIGFNGKLIYSKLDNTNSSYGCGLDIAISRTDSIKNLSYSFIIKNIGGQILPYHARAEPFPFDVQFGISQRLKHLPMRFGVLLHDLYRWNITYDDPALFKTNSLNSGDTATGKFSIVDNIFRHMNFSAEFYFGKSFRVGMGYDHQRRAELSYESSFGLSGFSFGFNIMTKKFDIGYALAKYSSVSSTNQISMVVKLNEFYKKH